MTASRADQSILSTDNTFQNRVRESLIAACVSISNEGWAVAFHRERADYARLVLANPDNFKAIVAEAAATDTVVIADATQAGTVVLTAGNVAAQAALVTDAHIDAAISAQFNSYVREPGS